MSKNYSLIELKSLFETIQDQIFSLLLDPSPASNSRFFQNFTSISLRTLKYISHYLHVLQHDEKIGTRVNSIYFNFFRSFNEYKGRNIYAESYLSTPLALNQDEQKQQDQIYHFMNTRNNNIPLRCLGTPQLQRQRMELALFVQQMGMKKVTLKEPKRSMQLPQEHPNLKVIRKTTYDPSFKPKVQEDHLSPILSEVPLTQDKMKDIEQVQTQTDCILHEFQTQTEKDVDQAKSQAQSCFKSEIAVGDDQNIQDSVKKRSKVSIKKQKLTKGVQAKGNQKKKKAQIASSTQQKYVRKQQKNMANQQINSTEKKQCSIKAICSALDKQISSKQVNVVYYRNELRILENQVSKSQNNQKVQQVYINDNQQIKIRLNTADFKRKSGMQVINQSQEEYNHLQAKSDQSVSRQEPQKQEIQASFHQSKENQVNDVKNKLKSVQSNSIRKSQCLPSASLQVYQTALSSVKYEQENNGVSLKKKVSKVHQRRATNLSNLSNNSLLSKSQDFTLSNNAQMQSKMQKGATQQSISLGQIKEIKKIELSKIKELLENSKLKQNKETTSQNNQKLEMAYFQQQLQTQDSHLAPINQNKKSNFERFTQLNMRTSKIQDVSKRLKNKFAHSTDYLDKYLNHSTDKSHNKLPKTNQSPFQSRTLKKGSLIIINNQGKGSKHNSIIEKSCDTSIRQSKNCMKSKVKLINLSKINQEEEKKLQQEINKKSISSTSKGLQSLNQNGTVNQCSINQSLKNSSVKIQSCSGEQKQQKTVLTNKKIAESCHLKNSKSQYNLIAKQLRQKNKRQVLVQYLELIEASHRKFCGENCIHLQNLHKRVNFDGTRSDQDVIDQLLRLIKKGK